MNEPQGNCMVFRNWRFILARLEKKMTTRREFLKLSALGGFGIFLPFKINLNQLTPKALAAVTPTLNVPDMPKFVTPLVIPPAMPRTTKIKQTMAEKHRLLRNCGAPIRAANFAGWFPGYNGVGLWVG